MDGGLVVPTTRHYALSVIRKPVCSAVRVFLALQVSRNFREPLTLRSRQRTISAFPSWDDFAHITSSATEFCYVVMLFTSVLLSLLASHFSLLTALLVLLAAVLRYCCAALLLYCFHFSTAFASYCGPAVLLCCGTGLVSRVPAAVSRFSFLPTYRKREEAVESDR
jgi:hypothetical protein